jgi:hypothetical protein
MRELVESYKDNRQATSATLEDVVDAVVEEPSLFSNLVAGLQSNSTGTRQRSAAAISELSSLQPHLLAEHGPVVSETAASTDDPLIQEHLASVLPQLPMEATDAGDVAQTLLEYRESENLVLVVEAIEALGTLAIRYPTCGERVRAALAMSADSERTIEAKRAEHVLANVDAASTED